MARDGVLLDGAGLRPSRQCWRQRYHLDGRREVVDGPFAETKEFIAGYTLIQVRSVEEARPGRRASPTPSRARSARSRCARSTRRPTSRPAATWPCRPERGRH
jgi:hypothetical protein